MTSNLKILLFSIVLDGRAISAQFVAITGLVSGMDDLA